MAESKPALVERPLYGMQSKILTCESMLRYNFTVFDLPEELLYTLTLKSERLPTAPEVQPQKETTPERKPSPAAEDGSPAKATSCNLCTLSFPTLQEQRQHVKSDLHKYNLKQKIRGAKPVTETEFERLIGELDESISGSDSESDSDEESEKESGLTTLLKKQARISEQGLEDDPTVKPRKGGSGKPPLLWLSSSALPPNTSLGIYRAIFSKEDQEEPSHIVDAIRRKQLSPVPEPRLDGQNPNGGVNLATKSPHYFLCMIGGGHFAGMIVSLVPKASKKSGFLERQATVLAHKTFHRYTTRRKQGGSQSANDSAKGNAHSAGSSLRRYNEAALTAEVRALLTEWKSMVDTAELLFIRATGNTNRQTLFGPYEGQVLRRNDLRVRGFPFSTRRATQSELMRAFIELTRVKVSQIDEAALEAATTKEAEKEEKTRAPTPKVDKAPRASPEEEAAQLHTTQLQSLIRRSKAPALFNYIQSNSIPPDFHFLPESSNYHAPTPLHLAASLSSTALITSLLTKAKADPTIRSSEGKTAYDLAGDRATRDAFRLARHQLGESTWPWDKTNIPFALSPVEAEAREKAEKAEKAAEDAKEAERRKQATEKLRKEDQERADERREKKHGVGKTLGAVVEKTGAERREEESRGMAPEVRARLERERRARAAEERIRRMQQGGRV